MSRSRGLLLKNGVKPDDLPLDADDEDGTLLPGNLKMAGLTPDSNGVVAQAYLPSQKKRKLNHPIYNAFEAGDGWYNMSYKIGYTRDHESSMDFRYPEIGEVLVFARGAEGDGEPLRLRIDEIVTVPLRARPSASEVKAFLKRSSFKAKLTPVK